MVDTIKALYPASERANRTVTFQWLPRNNQNWQHARELFGSSIVIRSAISKVSRIC